MGVGGGGAIVNFGRRRPPVTTYLPDRCRAVPEEPWLDGPAPGDNDTSPGATMVQRRQIVDGIIKDIAEGTRLPGTQPWSRESFAGWCAAAEENPDLAGPVLEALLGPVIDKRIIEVLRRVL